MISRLSPYFPLGILALNKATSAAFPASVKIDLSSKFNLKAASTGADDPLANFDGSGRAYPVEWLPKEPLYNYSGVLVRELRSYPFFFKLTRLPISSPFHPSTTPLPLIL
jgi:hypothetical protein